MGTGEGSARRARFHPLPEWVSASTRAVHAAARDDTNAGSVVYPIYQTSTFRYPAEFSEAHRVGTVHHYTRVDNPTQDVAAELIRSLEHAEAARVYGSGMGAISTAVVSFLASGDEVVALEDLYGGTLTLLTDVLPRFGVRVRWVPTSAVARPEESLSPATKLVFLESPTNPLLRVVDLKHWSEAAHAVGAKVVVDNTIASPVNQRPLALGADIVVHSVSKYLGGHSDLIGGAAAGSREAMERMDRTESVFGSCLDPFAAFLLARGLRTLPLRMERHNENGARVAAALRAEPAVGRVFYPGWEGAEAEAIASRQMLGRSGLVSVELRGGAPAAKRFLRALRLVQVATSFGGVESLVSLPQETSHVRLSAAELAARGIRPGLVRLSLGIEDPSDLVRDLTEAVRSTVEPASAGSESAALPAQAL